MRYLLSRPHFNNTQAKYASDLIAQAGLTDSKITSTPFKPNVKLTPLNEVPLEDATLYRQLVSSLVYLMVTQPYISYTVHIMSQYMSALRSSHYAVVL